MNDSDPKPTAAVASPDLQEQCAALQRQLGNLLLALVVLSCTFMTFLVWQARQIKRQYEFAKQQTTAILMQKTQVDNFLSRLGEFGRTHADFVPILNKYKIPISAPSATTSAPPVSVTPKKSLPAQPKK